MSKRIDDWFSEAKEDLESAVILLKNGKYHHSCFHAQQGAEKAVKAALLKFRISKVGHSVLALINELKTLTKVPADLIKAAQTLDQYYIPPRYPNAFDSGAPHQFYSEEQAEEAVELARKVIDFVRKLVSG